MDNSNLNIPTGVFAEKVTSIKHYTDRLFKFRITRPQSFRFRSGEFVMIGLPNSEKPISELTRLPVLPGMNKLNFIQSKLKMAH